MVFQCQKDSFLKEYVTKIDKIEVKGEEVEVIFEDTIFFPEGETLKKYQNQNKHFLIKTI